MIFFYSSGSGTTEYHISIRQIIAGILFIIAVVSDLLDGMLARRWDAVSKFGKFFDSIADKLLCNAVIIMMAVIKGATSLASDHPCVKGFLFRLTKANLGY